MSMISLGTAHPIAPDDGVGIRPGDGSAEVASVLACRACGTPARLVRIAGKPGARRAISGCVVCLTTTTRDLTDAESYVLWTMPQGDVFVYFAANSL